MMMDNEADKVSRSEPLQRRLRQLSARPVDLTRLESRIACEIPRPSKRQVLGIPAGALRAVAASLLVGIALLGLLLLNAPRTAVASTHDLLRLHETMVSHRSDMTEVTSAEAANAVLTGKWPDAPRFPSMPEQDAIACSIHRIGKAKAAMLVLHVDGVPVTLAAADASEVRVEGMQQVEQDGVIFQVSGVGATSMVITQHGGNWYCMIGQLPQKQLMAFWNALGTR